MQELIIDLRTSNLIYHTTCPTTRHKNCCIAVAASSNILRFRRYSVTKDRTRDSFPATGLRPFGSGQGGAGHNDHSINDNNFSTIRLENISTVYIQTCFAYDHRPDYHRACHVRTMYRDISRNGTTFLRCHPYGTTL